MVGATPAPRGLACALSQKKRFQVYSPARQRLRKLIALWALFGCTLVFLLALLEIGDLPTSITFKAGQVSPRTIKADRTVEVINTRATEAARKQAADAVSRVFLFDPRASQMSEDKLSTTYDLLGEVAGLRRASKAAASSARVRELLYQLPISLTPTALDTLTRSPQSKLQEMETRSHDLLWKVLENGVRTDGIAEARRSLQQEGEAKLSMVPPTVRQAIIETAAECIVPNRNYDQDATAGAQQAAMAGVGPVTTVLPEGAVVVREGEIISDDHMRVLEALKVNQVTFNGPRLLGHALLVCILMLVTLGYMSQMRRDLYTRPRELGLLATIAVITAFVCRSLSGLSPFLAPVAVASVLATMLIESRMAFLLTGFCALYVGVLTQSLPATCVGLISGVTAILALKRTDNRANLIAAMAVVALTNTLGTATFALIAAKTLQSGFYDMVFGFLNGLLSVALAVGVLPVLEHLFGVTTHFRLLDISNPGEPLLQRLLREAPGTYQHSIMVANLAESAAQAIGANALRCKVGAYYHDIGKMKRPRFFVENQMGGENPHDKLTPTLSTMIIHSHVKDGLEMAKQHKLPDVIVDFIAQHHGTSLVSYFYHQACKGCEGSATTTVFEEDFRYPGPKPQTRETAIVLICDGIEAAARCLRDPTPEKISELVNKMIRHHLEDGQLDECDLSLKDLRLIRESLVRSLQGIYHSRVEYPEPASLAGRRKVTNLRRKA